MSDPVYVGYHTLDNTLSMPNDARFLMYDPAKSGSYNITGALLKSQILASPVVTGQMTVPAGLASAPSMSTAGDTNTGIYFPAADQVGVTCGGVQRGLFSSTGLGVTGTITGTSFNSITALASVAPLIDGTATIGTSTAVARQDHIHPTDTTRAAVGQTTYIGTTAIALNRASASQALTGITSIDGSSASCTGAASLNVLKTGDVMTGRIATTMGGVIMHSNAAGYYGTDATGCVCITLPTSVNVMLDMDIYIQGYNGVHQITVRGYTYIGTSAWHNPAATCVSSTTAPTIRFASLTANNTAVRAILIGEVDQNWGGYYHVSIPRLSIGYAATSTYVPVITRITSMDAYTINSAIAPTIYSGSIFANTFTGALSGNATTASSVGSLTGIATVAPLIDGTATVGTSTLGARQDHVHPTDTSRAPAAGSTSVITLGTVTTGTWSGTTIATSKGGTGTTAAPVAGGVTYGVSTSALGTTAAGTSGYILRSNGAAAPSWTPNDLTSFPDSTFKKSVRVATTANITLSAVQTIDGIVLVAGDRVLVKNQTTTAQNGIYVVNASTWTRSTEADSSAEIASALVAVDSGTTNGGRLFTNIFKTTDVIGTTAMPWYEVASTSSFTTTATDIKVNGTQSVGTLNTFPRADHVHPVNTADQITQTASNVFLTPAQKTVATQAATSSVNGYLSSTDWTTFNNKQPAGSYATSGANSNITSLSGLTTPLSMSQGGLGTGTIVNNTVLTVGDNGSLSLRSPGPSGKKVLTGDLAGTPIFADIKTMAVDLSSDQTIGGTKTFSSLTNSGNLNFTGTGNRITGDFDNDVSSNRTMFKTSTTNGNTSVRSIPDGTSTTSSFGSYNNSKADNSGIILMVSSATNAFIHSTRTGTAAIQPLSLRINTVDHHMLTTSGNTILKTGVVAGDDDGVNKLQVNGSGKFTGNLTLDGSARRIIADFDNDTISNRTIFQTSTANKGTYLGIMPNGTSTTSSLRLFASSDPNNANFLNMVAGQNGVGLISSRFGTGITRPLTFGIGDASVNHHMLTTSGNTILKTGVLISDDDGSAKLQAFGGILERGAGGLGYGTGSGGTVTQATSKSTAVTLNKPTGQIVMHNAALASGAAVVFVFTNSTIGIKDTIQLNLVETVASYNYLLTCGIGAGNCVIGVRNMSAGSLSEALVINFTVIKGVTV